MNPKKEFEHSIKITPIENNEILKFTLKNNKKKYTIKNYYKIKFDKFELEIKRFKINLKSLNTKLQNNEKKTAWIIDGGDKESQRYAFERYLRKYKGIPFIGHYKVKRNTLSSNIKIHEIVKPKFIKKKNILLIFSFMTILKNIQPPKH
ncbi:hypothetical protein KAH94_02145 [bacterium]|nr:hypothetical protein [bacterium]